jgi:hypothetical protein
MKNKTLIVLVSALAVLICLILALLLFYAVTPSFLIILSFIIGIITGIFIAAIIHNLSIAIRSKRLNKAM